MLETIVKTLGLSVVRTYFRKVWGSSLIPWLFLIGILWSLFCHKKQIARIFLCYAVFLGLTVYNPLFVSFLTEKIGFDVEYYRFVWLLPVIPGVAYYAVRLVFSVKNRALRVLAAILAVAILVALGEPRTGVVQGFTAIRNIYKVPDDLRAVCSVIHEDSEEEQPRVVMSEDLNSTARQYDASLTLVLTRNEVLYRAGSRVVTVDTESRNYILQKTIMDLLYYNEAVDSEEFKAAIIAKQVDYLVLTLASPWHGLLKECGCKAVAQTESHVVYSFDWEAQ